MEITKKAKILIVDDIPANLISLAVLMRKVDAEILRASSGDEALLMSKEHEFALFLLDIQMPKMDGYQLATHLQNEVLTQDVPIIFITATLHNEVNVLKGYSYGAVDYIQKPINADILLAKVAIFLNLWQKNNQLNQLIEDIAEQNVLLQTEVAERRKLEVKLEHLAMYDALTNLPNRSLLKKEADKLLSAAKRYKHRVAFLFIDLDGFKAVNDTHGHETGDIVLIEMSYRMAAAVRDIDFVSRYGGDEFIIILPDCQSNADIELIIKRIYLEIQAPLESVSITEKLGASIGIACYPEDGTLSSDLISLADEAMYSVKSSGKNNFIFAKP